MAESVVRCGHCDHDVYFSDGKSCKSCKLPYCVDHTSEIDTKFCLDCLNETTTKIKIEPLVDTEGLHHNGVKLTPVGEFWFSSANTVAELTDEQLDKWLTSHKNKIKEAETKVSYHRLMVGMMQMEFEERKDAGIRRLKRIKVIIPKVQLKGIKVKAQFTIKDVADKLKAAGVTKEQLLAMMEAKRKGV